MARKILIIDDDPMMLEFLGDALEKKGREVLTAPGAKEGLKTAHAAKPDIILLDIMMPDMHGYEACRKLRDDEALAGVKIYFLSAKGYPADFAAAKSAGADGYLVKPFPIKKLFALIGD